MTLETARTILLERHGLHLVDMYHVSDLERPAYWVASTEDGRVRAEALSWGEVYSAVTGEAPV